LNTFSVSLSRKAFIIEGIITQSDNNVKHYVDTYNAPLLDGPEFGFG